MLHKFPFLHHINTLNITSYFLRKPEKLGIFACGNHKTLLKFSKILKYDLKLVKITGMQHCPACMCELPLMTIQNQLHFSPTSWALNKSCNYR